VHDPRADAVSNGYGTNYTTSVECNSASLSRPTIRYTRAVLVVGDSGTRLSSYAFG